LIINKTGTLWEVENFYENVYNVFDIMMYSTRMTQRLHPAMVNCIGAGEFTYEQLYDIVVEQNGYNPKTYIMNTVYNFGHIFDGIRDTYLFFVEDPRGNDKAVYQMGYNLGQALFYFIMPNIADYYSDAEPYRVKSFDLDAEFQIVQSEKTPEEIDAAAARMKILEKRLREAGLGGAALMASGIKTNGNIAVNPAEVLVPAAEERLRTRTILLHNDRES